MFELAELLWDWAAGVEGPDVRSHIETLIAHKLGSNQNCYTFTFISLEKIVMCSKFHWTKFIN